jgi:octaprenyl-diphosphate synthase
MPETPAENAAANAAKNANANAAPNAPTDRERASGAFFAPLRGHLRLLDEFLAAQTGEFEPAVRELVAETFAHAGKRLRPALVFYAGWTDGEPSPALVRAAAIVELVHLATLVHDDILDGALVRHNSPTVAARHGAHSAVLLGDALFAQALVLASQFPTTDVCRLVSAATRQVVSGEICQTFARGDARLPLEKYFRIIRLKTAELFEISCRLGAALGDTATGGAGSTAGAAAGDYASPYADACALFGRHLGTGYQIFDDVADLAGDEAGIGKTLGTDFESGKFTLPALLYLRQLEPGAAAAFAARMEQRLVAPAELADLMTAAGIPAECARAFRAEIDAADAALAPFADRVSFARLHGLCDYVRASFDALAVA